MISEEQAFQQMSPVDQLRAPSPRVGPEQAAANRKQNARDLLSIVPGPGNVIAAEDAVQAFGDAGRYRAEGKGGKAMGSAALGMLSAFGAVTGFPTSRLAGNAARGASTTAPAFPAWHGSPHDFDEFKLDKIGTGEGAQVYGHGLYFAENPSVATQYRDQLTARDIKTGYGNIDQELANIHGGNWEAFKAAHPNPPQGLAAAIADIEAKGIPSAANKGRLYKAEIDAEPHQLLDWDKPLSQQSEFMQQALTGLAKKHGLADPVKSQRSMSAFMYDLGHDSVTGSPAAASQALREAGIPGIRYLDQGSRGSDGGTSNYVIFDDKLVKILSKDAVPTAKGNIHNSIRENNKIGEAGDYRLHGPSSDDTFEIFRSDGKRVGDINVGQMDDGSVFLGPRIAPEYQKQGIATQIYKHIQDLAKRSGLELKKSNVRTPAGEALWKSIENR